jgi:hypothetical protein
MNELCLLMSILGKRKREEFGESERYGDVVVDFHVLLL